MLLFLSTLAHAAPSLTPADQAAHDALLARFDAHFDHAEANDGPDGCLTPLVAELKRAWHLFDAGERARMTGVLAPWKADLGAPMAPARPAGNDRAALADSCVGQQKDNRLEGEHFVVEWDDDVDDRYAPRFLEALEYSYGIETDDLGWRKPAGDGRYLMPAYIERGNYQGAYTTVEQCGSGYYPYMVAYSGSWADASWADTMAAHEFNHAIQFSYGFAHEFWWWEATATYVEDSVYDSDWWAYYVTGYSDSPHVAMNASDQQNQEIFWHMYGMAIWNVYIHENLGGMETVLDIWESGRDERGTYSWGQEDAFDELGLDFRTAYLDFITKNVSMDYADHRILPEVDTVGNVRALPASGAGEGASRPQGYGQNYVRVAGGLGTGDLTLGFTSDEGVAWAVGLVETDGRSVLRSEVQVIDALGAGTITLPDYGENDVYVVVSPLMDSTAKRDYAWTLAVVEPPPEPDPVVDEAATDDDVVISEPAWFGGCTCATGDMSEPGEAGSALLIAGACIVAARRRTRA